MASSKEDVQRIKERIDIVALISRYLSLTKSGENFKGRCPFHKDNSPSLTVNREKGLWHCFGCGEGGDLFAFLMKIERITFPEALQRLAQEAGVSLASRGDGLAEKLRIVSADAASYFRENLIKGPPGEKAREYLISRGYGPETWEKFGFGYSLPGWDDLKKRLSKKHGLKALTELGLVVESKGRVYDRFRDRVIFPISDLGGRTIAFGGRAFQGEPKYLNSPKTPLFDKGRNLYGLSWARESFSLERTAILVEGYTDVVSFHLAGITNAVGSMGTALTQGQADLLSRFVENVVIAYDQDAAGGAASLRGMRILRNSGLEVRVARLPSGDDPDSLVRREGAGGALAVMNAAIPFHLFFIESLKERFDVSTLEGKERALDDAREFYQGITSLPLREEIASLLSELLGLPLDGVRQDLGRRERSGRREEERVAGNGWGAEEVILALLLRGETSWDRVSAIAPAERFSQGNRPIAEAIAATTGPLDLSVLVQSLDEESSRRASYMALAPLRFSDAEKALRDALIGLIELPEIDKELARLRAETKTYAEAGDTGKVDELQRSYSSLIAKKSALVAQKHPRRGRDGKE